MQRILHRSALVLSRALPVSMTRAVGRALPLGYKYRRYTAKNTMTLFVNHAKTPRWITAFHIGFFVVGSIVPLVLIGSFVDEVPVSGRKRIMVVGYAIEKMIGDTIFQLVSESEKEHILPANDPRVKAVAIVGARIAAAIHDIETEVEGPQDSKAGAAVKPSAPPSIQAAAARPPWAAPQGGPDGSVTGTGARASGAISAVHEPSEATVSEPASNWSWHFLVIDKPILVSVTDRAYGRGHYDTDTACALPQNAYCAPGGTVVVYTGMLDFIDSNVCTAVVPLAHLSLTSRSFTPHFRLQTARSSPASRRWPW